jgi:hypothetical protein
MGGPIRVLSSVILGLASFGLILLAIIYNIHRLAVWIGEDDLTWRAVTIRKLPLTNVKAVALTATGNIRIDRTDGGKPVEIPASLMRSRSDVRNVLSVLKTVETPVPKNSVIPDGALAERADPGPSLHGLDAADDACCPAS